MQSSPHHSYWSPTRSRPLDPLTFYRSRMSHALFLQAVPSAVSMCHEKEEIRPLRCVQEESITLMRQLSVAVCPFCSVRSEMCTINKLLVVWDPSIYTRKDQCRGWHRRPDCLSPSHQMFLSEDNYTNTSELSSRATNGILERKRLT